MELEGEGFEGFAEGEAVCFFFDAHVLVEVGQRGELFEERLLVHRLLIIAAGLLFSLF